MLVTQAFFVFFARKLLQFVNGCDILLCDKLSYLGHCSFFVRNCHFYPCFWRFSLQKSCNINIRLNFACLVFNGSLFFVMYKYVVKRLLDFVLALLALIVLALPMLIIALAIKIDDPGPVLFKQKRAGKKKNGKMTCFMIWKFRSMKMSTPHDVPTHLLENPEQYITRVGKFIRKTSMDELPQICQVLTLKLSWVGPRPVICSEKALIEERDKYGANDIKPGITGWAQINGRDVLDSPEKAKFDGEYVAALNGGFFKGFLMDVKCFLYTIIRVLRCDGVVEGSAGAIKKQEESKEELVLK